jgi:hypothetical protein
MIDVIVGQKIPLSLQVYDGNGLLKVECRLIMPTGSEFLRAKLDHVGGGLYLNTSIEMPDEKYLIGQFLTDKPDDYEIAQDVFQGIPKVQPEEKYILGEVIDTVELSEQDDVLIGEVIDDSEEM